MTGPAVVVVLLLVLVWVVPVDVPERLPVVALSTHSIASPRTPSCALVQTAQDGDALDLVVEPRQLACYPFQRRLSGIFDLVERTGKGRANPDADVLKLVPKALRTGLEPVPVLYTNTPTAISASNTVITKPTGLARKAAFKPVCATVAVLVAAACPPSKPVIVSTVLPSPSSAFPPELTVRLNSANFTRAKAAANSLTPVLSVLVCSLHHAIESPAFLQHIACLLGAELHTVYQQIRQSFQTASGNPAVELCHQRVKLAVKPVHW